ncbi:MAG: glycoside hydrolase family 3 N-terminal domain-containing protein [bacterium]
MSAIEQTSGGQAIYRDPSRPIEARVEDLLARMTLEEKAAQMEQLMGGGLGALMESMPPEELFPWLTRLGVTEEQLAQLTTQANRALVRRDGGVDLERVKEALGSSGVGSIFGVGQFAPRQAAEAANKLQKVAVEETRLGIPILFCEEAVHGHLAQGATIFPQAIAMASTWNPELIERVGRAIGTEVRAVGGHQVYSPVLDLGRDPRWGRTEETYGEDPYLASRLAVAMVKGMQGGKLSDNDAIIAGPKHFGGHGEPLGGRDSNMEGITERDLREIHLVPFRAAVEEAGAKSIMAAYSMLDGIPCTCNRWLLTEVLRQEWGFDGHVVSDAGGVEGLHLKHRVAANQKEAVKLSIEAGLDTHIWGPGFVQPVVELVREGELAEEFVDRAVRRILRLKFLLGLFENPYVDPDRAERVCNAPEHRALALEVARQAIVLLKNEGGLLPLSKEVKTILVAGPNAHNERNQLGDYSGESPVVTILGGIKARVSPGTEVRYVKGCDVKGPSTEGIAEAAKAAKGADVAVVVLGESSWTAEITSGEGADRAELDLPGVQEQLLKAIYKTGTPVVLVLINGRPLTIKWAAEHVPAIVEAWYPGQEGGTAVAEVLFGDYNPGGKLPITIPQTVGQLPLYYNYKPSGRAYDYVFTPFKPLFEFGYGLSYTRFEYSNLTITPEVIGPAGTVTVRVSVRNSGEHKGDEVVQLYINDVVSSVVTPVKELRGFKRITLEPGESQTVEFTLGPRHLSLLDRHLERVVEPGAFEVMIGGLKGTFQVR